MSRRSFDRIVGNLDLTGRLSLYDALPNPWNPLLMFGRVAPIELEIGSGKGLFLRKAAQANPAHDFLGIEVAYRYALISAAQLAKNGVKNSLMVNADAAKLLAERVPTESLAAVHVYFPDPWWKKSHRKRRILRADVVKMIENRLLPGGTLYFRTDVEEYYRSTLELVAAETTLQGPVETENGALALPEALPVERGMDNPPARKSAPQTDPDTLDFSTHFERRTRLNHLPVYGCYWTKSLPKSLSKPTDSA